MMPRPHYKHKPQHTGPAPLSASGRKEEEKEEEEEKREAQSCLVCYQPWSADLLGP